MTLKPGAALLFDIDGTLVESDPLHLRAFNAVFGPRGQVFDHASFALELQGKANEAIAARFLPDETPERQREIMGEKEAAFRALAADGVEPVAGLGALLDWADEQGIPAVAVTNAPRANAEMLLGSIAATRRFKALVIGEELEHGKPHPLPYLEGMRLVGADPAASVAFEDSLTGVASASAAGIATVGIMTGLKEQALLSAGAVLAVRDFADPRLRQLVQDRLLA
jgi:phosphoglycolate phosphatase